MQLRAGASYCLVFGRAASLARSACHASYSGVPRRGGTSFGIPPSHVGTVSATIPLVEAQADSVMHAMAAKGVITLSFMGAITSPNHVESMATASVGVRPTAQTRPCAGAAAVWRVRYWPGSTDYLRTTPGQPPRRIAGIRPRFCNILGNDRPGANHYVVADFDRHDGGV